MRGMTWVGMSLGVGLVACSPSTAAVTNGWVFVASSGNAVAAPAPSEATPLPGADARACFTNAEIDDHFGPTCPNHEAEAKASPDMNDDFHPGAQPTPSQVRWYCSCPMVVRVVLDRCAGADTFHVSQVAVRTKGGCSDAR